MDEIAAIDAGQREIDNIRGELAQARGAARDAYRNSATLVRLLTVVGQPIPPQKLIDQTLIALSDLFTAGVACVVEILGDEMFVRDACGVAKEDRPGDAGWRADPMALEALASQSPRVCSYKSGDPLARMLGEEGVLGAFIPLAGASSSSQLLMLIRSIAQPFSVQDLQVLASVASRLQVSVEAGRRGVVIERLEHAALELAKHLDQHALLATAARLLRELSEADAAWIVTADGEFATLGGHDGVNQAFLATWPRPLAGLPGWRELKQGKAFSITDGRYVWLHEGLSSIISMPLMRDGHPRFLLCAGKRGAHAFSPESAEAVTIFGSHLDAAIANASLYDALSHSEASLRLITDSINDMVAVVDEVGIFKYASPSYRRQLGLDPDALIGRSAVELVVADDRERLRAALAHRNQETTVEYRVNRDDGDAVWVETAVRRPSDSLTGTVLSSRIVNDRKRLEDELRHRAMHDPLTGLANRILIGERLDALLSDGQTVGVLFCDVDKFKAVNDRLGHEAGDDLLRHVARRLQQCIRPGDILARFGGDEFVAVLEDVGDRDTLRMVAERILRTMIGPIALGRETVHVSISIGAVTCSGGASSASEMVRDADAAMYVAKQRGGADVEIFDDIASHLSVDRLSLASEVGTAADRGELSLHYQPAFNLETGRFKTLEALLRWNHPTRGPISPELFIPLAEESGAIVALGEWVLRDACRQLAAWHRAGARDVWIAVNVSAVELQHEGYATRLLNIIDEAGLTTYDVWLEITERGYLYETAVRQIQRLREAGIRFALDDFGMSYSNFSFLKRHAIECLKIDKSLVSDVTDGGIGRSIVAAIMTLGMSLQVPVVAEGIETIEQRDALLELGCVEGQGYLFARPEPVDVVTKAIFGRAAVAS